MRSDLLSRQLKRLSISENTALLAMAVGVGLATGLSVWIYHTAFDASTDLFHRLTEALVPVLGVLAVVFTVALGGFIVGWVVDRLIGEERHHGVAGIIEAVALGGGRLRYWRMPFKTLGSILSIGAGASVGPEAPSVIIGANIGSYFGQKLKLSEDRVRLLVAAGAASAIGSIFHAPISGVFFALEVVLNGEFSTSSFGIVVLAAVVASVFTQAIDQGGPELGFRAYTIGNPLGVVLYVILGLLLAPVGAIFIRIIFWQHDLWHKHVHLSRPLKTALAGAIVGAVAIFLPQIMGTGRDTMNAVLNASDGQFTIGLLLVLGLAKMLMTSVSLAGDFVGGIFAPALFVGTVLGGAFGRLMAVTFPVAVTGDTQGFAIAGMAAIMGGVVRAPITAILLVFEITNDYRLILPIMLTTVVCVYLTEKFEPAGLDMTQLLRKGIRLQQGRDVDLMQSMTVGEVMQTPAPTIGEKATLSDLRDALASYKTRSLCVVDDEGLLSGIVTLADLQQAYLTQNGGKPPTVGDICTRQLITATPDDVLWTVIRSMGAREIGRVPVVKPGTKQLLGMVSRQHIMQGYGMAVMRKVEDQHRAEQARLSMLTGAHVFEMHINIGSEADGKTIQDIHWPKESVIASVRHKNKVIVPHGSTELHGGDTLTIVADPEVEDELHTLLDNKTS